MVVNATDERGPDRDFLTGLANLDYALEEIAAWRSDAERRRSVAPVHAMLVGIRRFDTINLAFGEPTGNAALVELAARIQRFAQAEFEGEWVAARVGGGSFLLACTDPCSREAWEWQAEALAEILSDPIMRSSSSSSFRLWPRIALMRGVSDEAPEVMFDRLAETAGQLQQETGRRIAWVDGSVALPGRSSAQLEADLLSALDHDEIEILYQPQFSADGDRLVGAEALARWQHPTLGKIGGAALFAIAERADFVPQLSRHISQRALCGAAEWPNHLRLSLNVTAADLANASFAEDMAKLLTESGLEPERLTLEITEQVLVPDIRRSAKGLGHLVDLGIRVALDDFGAGFCNFNYLKILPLHYLKLDRSMVEGIASDEKDLAVLRGILAMAKALGLLVIAEGVETEAQRALIEREGCNFFQGFLRATPMTGTEMMRFALN